MALETTATSASPPAPVLFNADCPGLDTRIMVFHQALHVHSFMLKMHSKFFQKFMDRPGVQTQSLNCGSEPPVKPEFRYEYVLQNDSDDGVWGLQPRYMVRSHYDYWNV